MAIEIELTQGYKTLVDAEDVDLASQHCRISIERSGVYVRRRIREGKIQRSEGLHRTIMSRVLGRLLERSELIDHIDGNPLNNQRGNLRIADSGQNSQNKRLSKANTSGYKGVTWHKQLGKWQASIKQNHQYHHLGLFDTPEAAHQAYRDAALRMFGDFANFGESQPGVRA